MGAFLGNTSKSASSFCPRNGLLTMVVHRLSNGLSLVLHRIVVSNCPSHSQTINIASSMHRRVLVVNFSRFHVEVSILIVPVGELVGDEVVGDTVGNTVGAEADAGHCEALAQPSNQPTPISARRKLTMTGCLQCIALRNVLQISIHVVRGNHSTRQTWLCMILLHIQVRLERQDMTIYKNYHRTTLVAFSKKCNTVCMVKH